MVKKEEFLFDSRDGKSRIHAVRWVPEGKICCILQVVHGMAEFVERYEPMAMYLGEKGIMVTGEDHLGHGKSVGENGKYGFFCEQDPATVVVRDVHRLNKDENLKEMPKDLPVLFIAGTDDPVGNYGEGVRKAQEDFKRVGMKRTSLRLYEGCRHEILNEPIKQQIFDDIYAWVMERVEEY